jgi:hypothetical protein
VYKHLWYQLTSDLCPFLVKFSINVAILMSVYYMLQINSYYFRHCILSQVSSNRTFLKLDLFPSLYRDEPFKMCPANETICTNLVGMIPPLCLMMETDPVSKTGLNNFNRTEKSKITVTFTSEFQLADSCYAES